MDDYTTRVGGNHYREIACYVRAAAGGSVLVAATPVSDWGKYGGSAGTGCHRLPRGLSAACGRG